MLNPEPQTGYGERPGWRGKVNSVIFGFDTPAGKAFDIVLIVVIVLSVICVMLESVTSIRSSYGDLLITLEWIFTILFTIEYILRLMTAVRPARYALSFFGIVDLLATIPTYLAILFPGAQFLLIIRLLRILRVFRVLKLVKYLKEADLLVLALRNSARKITLFVFTVVVLVTLLGSLMYLVEGEQNGFTSIPKSIYWAIVTLTTVGYGDISPQTPVGQALASLVMILGYGIIAVPTGIVTAEIVSVGRDRRRGCKNCGLETHDSDAIFCKQCGNSLNQM